MIVASLNCRLPGDFGFDPLGLGEEPAALKWYVQAELVHCRFAMAGVAGILVTDVSYLPTSFSYLPDEQIRGSIEYVLRASADD